MRPCNFAYVHATPDARDVADIFYVGKGSVKRARNMSLRHADHRAVTEVFGSENTLIGVIECSTDEIALELEKGLIKCLRRVGAPLVNKMSHGGRGATGVKHSPEVRRKISEGKKGDRNPMKRPEVVAKAHATRQRNLEIRGRKTKKPSDRMPWAETMKLHRQRFIDNNPAATPEGRELRREWQKARWQDKALRNRMSENMRLAWTAERKAKASVSNVSHRPEVNAKKSAALKGYVWPRVVCPHCGAEGTQNIMKRWHFDRCKKQGEK